MYQLLGTPKDNKFCLIDHEKLWILSLDEEDIWEMLLYDKASIMGLTLDMVQFKHRWFGTSQCDWADGENLFLRTTNFRIADNGRFTIVAKERAINGVVNQSDDLAVVFEFDFGMCVPVLREDFDEFLCGDTQRIVATLKRLATPPEDCAWLLSDYNAAKSSGDTNRLRDIVRKMVSVGAYPLHDKDE